MFGMSHFEWKLTEPAEAADFFWQCIQSYPKIGHAFN